MLGGIRTRNQRKTAAPDPTLASQIVTNYLIPLFEADSQLRGDISRSATFGTFKTAKSPLEPVSGTVYGELKLSEQLGKELANVKKKLADTEEKLKEAEQRQASALSDLTHTQNYAVTLESELKILRFQSILDLKETQESEFREIRLQQELKSLQESYISLENQIKIGNATIQDQYAVIDKLRNKATEQEHITSLLLMENDIIGERLKGLYFAIQQVADSHTVEERIRGEVEIMGNSNKEMTEYVTKLGLDLREAINHKDSCQSDNFEIVAFRENLKAEKEKLAKVAKEKVTDLLASLQKTEDEREKLTIKFEELEKNFKDLTEEYEKMRQKAKQYRQRRKQYGEEEEKVCKNCQKVFVESDNFNWSCRRHQTEYSGEIYWCCGKSSRDAIGCKISKHESKEDDDEDNIAKDAADQVTLKCAVRTI